MYTVAALARFQRLLWLPPPWSESDFRESDKLQYAKCVGLGFSSGTFGLQSALIAQRLLDLFRCRTGGRTSLEPTRAFQTSFPSNSQALNCCMVSCANFKPVNLIPATKPLQPASLCGQVAPGWDKRRWQLTRCCRMSRLFRTLGLTAR